MEKSIYLLFIFLISCVPKNTFSEIDSFGKMDMIFWSSYTNSNMYWKFREKSLDIYFYDEGDELTTYHKKFEKIYFSNEVGDDGEHLRLFLFMENGFYLVTLYEHLVSIKTGGFYSPSEYLIGKGENPETNPSNYRFTNEITGVVLENPPPMGLY